MTARLFNQRGRDPIAERIGGSRAHREQDGRTFMARFLRSGVKQKGRSAHGQFPAAVD
jgi:hypothetical protein